MPNWCHNEITISGSKEEIAEILSKTKTADSSFDFAGIRPVPQELSEGEGWYNWCLQNWGTKWSFNDQHLNLDATEKEISVVCLSAWDPPVEFFRYLTEQYPSVEVDMRWAEPGNDFAGGASCKDGVAEVSEYDEEDKQLYFEELGYAEEEDDREDT